MKTSLLLLLSIVHALICLLFLALPVAAQEVLPDTRRLVPGEKSERDVAGQEEFHAYTIELKRGQVLRLSFQERGADIAVVMVRLSDEKKASASSNYGSGFMRESLTLIADQDATYVLVIRAQRVTEPNVNSRYEFEASLKPEATRSDTQRAEVETLMEEASKLLEGTDKAGLSLAVTKFQQGLKIWQALADEYWMAITTASIGNAYFRAENFAQAKLHLTQALVNFERNNNEQAIAWISLSLGSLHIISQNAVAARPYLNRAFEISKRLGDKRTQSLTGMLGAASALNDSESGGDISEELNRARAKNDKLAEASIWAKTLFHYVIEEDSTADEKQRSLFEKAEREAIPLMKIVKNRDIELQILLALGVGFYDLTLAAETEEEADRANREKSLNYVRQAIVLAKNQNNSIIQALAYEQLNLFYDGDNNGLAIFFGKKAINSIQNLKQDLKFGDKQTQQDAARRFEELYSSLAEDLFFEARLAEAHQVLNFGRDQEFFDSKLLQTQNVATLSLTLREEENERLFDGAVRSVALKYANRADADYQLAGNELREALNRLEQNFRAPRSERDIIRNVPDTTEMQSALQTLSSKTGRTHAAIYFVDNIGETLLITPDGVSAFTSGTQDLSTFVPSVQIDEYISDFLEILKSPKPDKLDPRPLGAQIYNKIFKTKELVNGQTTNTTLEDKLARSKPDVLLWSLSGRMRYVPVAALYDAHTKQYLVEKYQNVVFTRARKERFLVEPKSWEHGIGFGTSLPYAGLSELPHVPDELATIFGNVDTKQKGLFNGQIFLNRAFTRQAMQTIQQTKPPFVHIASHFVFRPGDSQNSFLLLGDGTKLSLFNMQQTPNLFSEVDLLTLSACETAAQEPDATGKEVDGFAELAQRLGASSVMASLWEVSDQGTSKLMTEFYRLRKENPKAPKSEILQKAQLNLLYGKGTAEDRKRRSNSIDLNKARTIKIPFEPSVEAPFEHPFYWAAFVLFGSPR